MYPNDRPYNHIAWIRRFYSSSTWQKKREHILRRDNYLCRYCLAGGTITIANEVHHENELAEHPELGLDDSNLVSLCRTCHEKTKNKKKKIKLKNKKVRVIKI